jgi:hypothetical protein
VVIKDIPVNTGITDPTGATNLAHSHTVPAATLNANQSNHSHSVPSQGGGGAHNNEPRYMNMVYIFKIY